MTSSFQKLCIFCKVDNNEEVNEVKSKGLQTIVNWSLKRDRSEVYKEIVKNKETAVTVYVHHSCRRRFTDPRTRSTKAAEVSPAKRLRSAENNFDWKQGRSQKVPKGGAKSGKEKSRTKNFCVFSL